MESIEKHCSGKLVIDDYEYFGAYRGESFHIHPHYELMICTYPIRLRHILCGQKINTDYPVAVLTSSFVPHFTYANMGEANAVTRAVLYFDDSVLSGCPLPFTTKELLGGGAVRIFNLSTCCQTLRMYLKRLREVQDAWERMQLFSVILNRLFVCRKGSTVLMDGASDYIFQVIDYITTHLDEKLTVEVLAAHFFVSPDKLKKNFKQSTYTNIGDFIQEMRLNRAKELLEKRIPVNEVIRQCGYESSSYFFKWFKEETGKTPLQFGK